MKKSKLKKAGLGTVEEILLPMPRFRDSKGKPTCAASFEKRGHFCQFISLAKLGTVEFCTAMGDRLYRDGDDGGGYLQPHADCPIWEDGKKEA